MRVVAARLGLLPAERGGLQSPLPSGARSLLLVFPPLEQTGGDVRIGAVIDVADGGALVPGAEEVPVVIRFWADEAAVYATPGATFALWYGRAVGEGVVMRLADEAGAPDAAGQLAPPVMRRSLALVVMASMTAVMVARSSSVSWLRSASRASSALPGACRGRRGASGVTR